MRQPTSYNGASGRVANEEEHVAHHATASEPVEPVHLPRQPLYFDEASLAADKLVDGVFDDPGEAVYDIEAVFCAHAALERPRAAPADPDAHLVCAPLEVPAEFIVWPEVLAKVIVPDCYYPPILIDSGAGRPDCTPYKLALNAACKLDAVAPPASLLDCFKGALAGLLGFFGAG